MSGCRPAGGCSFPGQIPQQKDGGPNGTKTCHLLSRGSLPEPDPALWLSRPGSTRHAELTLFEVSPVRRRRHCSGVWNDLCRCAGPGRDAQATVKCGHEPKNDGNHGYLSGSMGLLRLVDSFATGDRMERGRGGDQFPKCRRVLSFRPQRKSRTEEHGWELTERKGLPIVDVKSPLHSMTSGQNVQRPVLAN